MDMNFSAADAQFRQQVREFFSTQYPKDLLQKAASGVSLDKIDYQRAERALAEQGWLCVNWPEQYGGPGWTPNQKYIFDQELEAAGAISPVPMGVIYVGPVICAFGSDEQKARWLPGIQESTTFWAQGYSEPDAGSDLASLNMQAAKDGDVYRVTGTKTWTSLAQHADWMFLLARTSTEERKQQGITFLCVSMDMPGIEVHPIISIDGRHSLNRVTFDDVVIPVENRIGNEGEGWHCANFLLGNERTSYAHVAQKRMQMAAIGAYVAGDPYLNNDSAFRQRVDALHVRLDALDLTVLRTLASVADGESPGDESSILKILATEIAQDITELAMLMHASSLVEKFEPDNPRQPAKATMEYLGTRAQSIYGGANEIQKNIIAKRVLQL